MQFIIKTMKMKTRDIALSGIFIALLIVCSWLTIPVGAVPITLSLFAVFLIGAMLTPANAVLICFIYLLLGLAGLPVFSGFGAGLYKIIGPTGGYLISYPIMAAVISFSVKYGKNPLFYPIGMAASLIICYALGVSYMLISLDITLQGALVSGVAPFILPDAAKIALASLLALKLNPIIKKSKARSIA